MVENKPVYLIEKIHIDGVFWFTGQWKHGTNPIFSSDPDRATQFRLKTEAEDYNRQRSIEGVVTEHIFY